MILRVHDPYVDHRSCWQSEAGQLWLEPAFYIRVATEDYIKKASTVLINHSNSCLPNEEKKERKKRVLATQNRNLVDQVSIRVEWVHE